MFFFLWKATQLWVFLAKNNSLLSTDKQCHHIAAHVNLHIPCSHCVTVSEHWSCWCRFILTGNNTTTHVCCQNRILIGGILLNQINKKA